MAKKLNVRWNFLRKLDIININYKPIKNPLKAHYEAHHEARKITIGFSGFGPKKTGPEPNRNRSVWTGSVWVPLFCVFAFRFGCF